MARNRNPLKLAKQMDRTRGSSGGAAMRNQGCLWNLWASPGADPGAGKCQKSVRTLASSAPSWRLRGLSCLPFAVLQVPASLLCS